MDAFTLGRDLLEILFRATARENCLAIHRGAVNDANNTTDEEAAKRHNETAEQYLHQASNNVEDGERACRSLVFQLRNMDAQDCPEALFAAVQTLIKNDAIWVDMELASE